MDKLTGAAAAPGAITSKPHTLHRVRKLLRWARGAHMSVAVVGASRHKSAVSLLVLVGVPGCADQRPLSAGLVVAQQTTQARSPGQASRGKEITAVHETRPAVAVAVVLALPGQ